MMKIQEIFLAALEVDDLQQRADYLMQACGNDPVLHRKVTALLAAHERSGEFLDIPALQQMAGDQSQNEREEEQKNAREGIDLAFLQPSSKPDSLGRLLHYEVLEVVGRGGCGIVLKAFDEKLHRVVAIKTMIPELAATSPARKRFLREARATAAIRHDNVVSIYAVEEKPLPFLVMEYIDGQTLQDKLNEHGPLETKDVLSIGRQIALGLEAAHSQGLIHRDIKPANILLENGTGRPKITDFGLVRSADDASLTQSGVISGTPLYMSPEQAQGQEVDHRSDLFSLGSVIYVMCCGRPPFRASTAIAVLKRVVEEQPRPIREIIPEVPEWLVAMIAKLHAKNPKERFASAKEVSDLLTNYLSDLQQHGRVQLPVSTRQQDNFPKEHSPNEVAEDAEPVPTKTSLPERSQYRNWALAASIMLALMLSLGVAEATGITDVRGTVIRLFSPKGTLVVEVDDPGISVTIDGEEMVITGAGAKEIRLKPGQYELLVSKNGQIVRQELVTVSTEGRQVVRVSKEATPTRSPTVNADPDRNAAEYVLSIGGKVQVNGASTKITSLQDLPDGPFRLTAVNLLNNTNVTESGLKNFSGTTQIQFLELSGATHVNDAALAYFRENRSLKELGLAFVNIRGDGLAMLQDCKELTVLWLNGSKVTDDALAFVAKCPSLNILGLSSCPISDRGLIHFANHPELARIDAEFTQVSDDALKVAKTLTKLHHLTLRGTEITDRGLMHLKGSRSLRHLNLDETLITDQGLKELGENKPLRVLAARLTDVTLAGAEELSRQLPDCEVKWNGGVWKGGTAHLVHDADYQAAQYVFSVGGFVKIKGNGSEIRQQSQLPPSPFVISFVSLDGCQKATDKGLRVFENCTEIIGLTLNYTSITDEGLTHFRNCRKLKTLACNMSKVNGTGLAAFSECNNLEGLSLWMTPLTREKLLPLANKSFKHLNIGGITAVSDDWISHFTNIGNLEFLNLRYTDVGDNGLAHFQHCEKLKYVSLGKTKVTDAGLVHLQNCNAIETLVLSETVITDASITAIKGFKNLRNLEIEHTKITASGVESLRQALPQCKITWNGGVIEPAKS